MAQNAHTRQCGQSMLGLNVDMTGNNNNNTTKRAREQLDGAGSRGGHRGDVAAPTSASRGYGTYTGVLKMHWWRQATLRKTLSHM